MAKAMLIMDMPTCCKECDFVLSSIRYCTRKHEYIGRNSLYGEKPEWCPLHGVPDKKLYSVIDTSYNRGVKVGYNACIDEILGGGE